jgi:hypothetical protein
MFSKSDWREILIKVIAGILTALVLALITSVWGIISSDLRPLLILGGILTVFLFLVVMFAYRRIRNTIKFRPSLAIRVQDISCQVRPYETRSVDRRIATETGIEWFVECAVEIENRRGIPVHDITGEMRLVLGREEFAYTHHVGNFAVDGNKSQRFLIPFGKTSLKFPIKDTSPNLNIAYCLEYSYTFAIDGVKASRQFKTRASGSLKKADWIGDSDILYRFRTLGFHRIG